MTFRQKSISGNGQIFPSYDTVIQALIHDYREVDKGWRNAHHCIQIQASTDQSLQWQ